MDGATKPQKHRILSIDAWADCEPRSWQWNNWFDVGSITAAELAELTTNRKLIAYMRRNNYLGSKSAGLISITEDELNIVFCERTNDRPLFAIEIGDSTDIDEGE